jgi:molybdopterin-guanine dinucleotide biosynthesis adapter protein
MASVIGFAGYSNSGKTTLISKVTAILKERGYRVAVIKHDAHGHYKEVPGTDSTLFIASGADTVINVSPNAIHKYEKQEDIRLDEVVMSLQSMDFVLVEGFKSEEHAKIAVFRSLEQSGVVDKLAPPVVAIACDIDFERMGLPIFHLDGEMEIAAFIESRCWEKI